MIIIEHSAQIENGKLILKDREGFILSLSRLEGKDVKVVVRERHATRSLNQNAYLWGVVYKVISDETGEDSDRLHDIFRTLFLTEHRSFRGKYLDVVKSTTGLSKIEMMEYITNIIVYASRELGIYIPSSDEVSGKLSVY